MIDFVLLLFSLVVLMALKMSAMDIAKLKSRIKMLEKDHEAMGCGASHFAYLCPTCYGGPSCCTCRCGRSDD